MIILKMYQIRLHCILWSYSTLPTYASFNEPTNVFFHARFRVYSSGDFWGLDLEVVGCVEGGGVRKTFIWYKMFCQNELFTGLGILLISVSSFVAF